jgi:hypothetical protein
VALGSIVIGAPALAVALLIAMLLMHRRRRGCPSSVALRSEPRRF